MKKNGWFTL
jgi:hypothetical protein